MSNLLKKLKIIPPIDWKIITDEDKLKEKAQVDAKILEEYLPYTSDYNSCLLFSLNGVVLDDNEISYGTNFFSNKKCAVIELLEEHIKNVVSLTPIDTLIKGDVPLSKKAIILIEEETYQKLPPLEKRTIRKP